MDTNDSSSSQAVIPLRLVLWFYLLLLGTVLMVMIFLFMLYGMMAFTPLQNQEAFLRALDVVGKAAESFADIAKLMIGAILGAFGMMFYQALSAGKPALVQKIEEVLAIQPKPVTPIAPPPPPAPITSVSSVPVSDAPLPEVGAEANADHPPTA